MSVKKQIDKLVATRQAQHKGEARYEEHLSFTRMTRRKLTRRQRGTALVLSTSLAPGGVIYGGDVIGSGAAPRANDVPGGG